MLMSDQSPKLKEAIWMDTRNAIFLPDSEGGHSHSISQHGQQADLFGPDHAHASLSASAASDSAKLTKDTCGQNSCDSLTSAVLQQFLASRLPHRMAGYGSPGDGLALEDLGMS